MDFAINNLKRLICHKTQTTNQPTILTDTLDILPVMVKVLANGPGDLGSIPDRVIPKTLKVVLDTSLLSTRQYKVRIKVEQSWERSNAHPLHLDVVAIEKGAVWSPSTTVANFLL